MKIEYSLQNDGHWIETAKQKPTPKDQDRDGRVLAISFYSKEARLGRVFIVKGFWVRLCPDQYPLWIPLPAGVWRKDLPK